MTGRRIRVDVPLLGELRRVHAETAKMLPRAVDPGLAAVGLIGR